MKLHFRKLGEGEPLVILHGIFGSADNWQTLGKQLATDFTVYLVDQRNHGLSPHSPEFNYEVMVEDLRELFEDENIASGFIVGHSMGGKTAMNFAVRYPGRVKKLVVVDIAPRAYPPHHRQVIDGFKSVDTNTVRSRSEADAQLSASIRDPGIRQFMLKNLARNEHGNFSWRLNLDAIEKQAERIGQGFNDSSLYNGDTLFIGGGDSDYIQAGDHALIKHHFSNSRLEIIPGAGHWVHAEKPGETYEIIKAFLTPPAHPGLHHW